MMSKKDLIRELKIGVEQHMLNDKKREELVVHDSKLDIYSDFICRRYGIQMKQSQI